MNLSEKFLDRCVVRCVKQRRHTVKQNNVDSTFLIFMQILTNCGSLGWPVVVRNSVSDKTDEKKIRKLLISGNHLYNFGSMPESVLRIQFM